MSRHPAGKGRPTAPAPIALVADDGSLVPAKVVYTTATGEAPRGGQSLTSEATAVVPAPTKRVRKTTTKKAKPRVRAKAEPLHTDIKVDKRVWSKAKSILAEGRYKTIEVVDSETVIVR